MSTSVRLLLPAQLHADMLQQARTELPNECCGLLAGTIDTTGTARVTRRFPLTNAAASPREFWSDPHSMFAAERARRQEGLEILAIYHSHPTSDPVPSRTDLERNYSPDVMNLIIALNQEPPLVRAWWLDEKGYREGEWALADA